ncbi:MAG TPA: aminotransferase class III-fold pyridoxal phosphate-dependent enzyme [Saprospiraceae bacterium]|nr:aminotransferase class III-fold pyridoxal phosphate-dependent enzyme [Saprospiraceae bacterium]
MQTQTQIPTKHYYQENLDYSLFSWSKQGGLKPWHISHGKGVYLYTIDGKRILDFSSQLMNVNIGHGHPAVAEAVMKQMSQVSYIAPNMVTDIRGQLAAKLAEITPGNLTKTLFTLAGSESIENAIKLARIYTGRHKIIAQYRSYHGATYGAITASGDPRRLKVDSQQVPNIIHVENPYFYRCPWNSKTIEECGEMALRNLEQIVAYEDPNNVAAILMEGESGSSGCIKYPPFYLKKVKTLCEKYGILFIADEVMSGFGRTGKWFGVDHHEVTPDIMCMAKGLTCGYLPLGAMTVTDTIANAFNDIELPLGLTYSAHAAACAAGLAVLNIYEDEDLISRAAENGRYIDHCLAELMATHPSVGDVRNTGMLGVIELVKNRETKEPMAPFNAKASEIGEMNKVASKLRELGMYTFVRWNYIFVAPPLVSTHEEIDEGFGMINEALNQLK